MVLWEVFVGAAFGPTVVVGVLLFCVCLLFAGFWTHSLVCGCFEVFVLGGVWLLQVFVLAAVWMFVLGSFVSAEGCSLFLLRVCFGWSVVLEGCWTHKLLA